MGPKAITVLIELLKDEELRPIAKTLLVKLSTDSLPALTQALRNPQIRDFAAITLARIGETAIPVLLAALQDGDAGVRASGVHGFSTMEKIPATARSCLHDLLADPDTTVRIRAAWVLGRLQEPAAMPVLIAGFQGQEPTVQRESSAVLGLMPIARPFLHKARRHPEATIRSNAGYGLLERPEELEIPLLQELLQDPDPSVQLRAAWTMAQRRQPSVLPMLLQALQDPDPTIRQRTAAALGAINTEAVVTALRKTIHDPSLVVRRAAISALTGLGNQAIVAIPDLIAALGDPDLDRSEIDILHYFWDYGKDQPLPMVMEAVKTIHIYHAARIVGIWAERNHKEARVIQVLLGLFQESDEKKQVRITAILRELLRHMPEVPPTVIPALVSTLETALSNRSPAIRRDAVEILGGLGKKWMSALHLLQRILQDNDPQVRRSGLEVLSSQGDQAIPMIAEACKDEDHLVRIVAIYALLKRDEKGIPYLAQLLSNADPELRQVIVTELRMSLDRFFLPILHNPGADAQLRLDVITIVGEMDRDAESAVPILEKLSQDAVLGTAARTALTKIKKAMSHE